MFSYAGVKIRPVDENDLTQMIALRSIQSVWENLGDIEMVTLHKQTKWFKGLLKDTKRKYYILCNEQIDFLGIIRMDEIDNINRSIRIGGDILPKYQNKGYGTRMYTLLKKYCFDYLNMNRIWLLVLETNEKAIYLYTKMGFKKEGRQRKAIYRNGKYIDYIMMSILKSEYSSSPSR